MMEWSIRIDARPEFQHYKNLSSDVVEKAVFEGHLLDIIYLETTNWRGEKNVLFGFPINDCFKMPEDKNVAVTHESYSEPIGKLTCFQTDLLDIKGVRKTHQNNLIANYLLQRIQGMKNKRNKKLGIDSILFETLQKDCRLENSSKQQMYSIRETIMKMLEHWKEKGHIKDYKLIKGKGGVYHSIEIELPEAKKKMVEMNFEEAIRYIHENPQVYLTATGKKGGGYICPICGSGSGSHRTGIIPDKNETWKFTCFANGCFPPKSDVINIIGAKENLDNKQAMFRAFEIYGITLKKKF